MTIVYILTRYEAYDASGRIDSPMTYTFSSLTKARAAAQVLHHLTGRIGKLHWTDSKYEPNALEAEADGFEYQLVESIVNDDVMLGFNSVREAYGDIDDIGELEQAANPAISYYRQVMNKD